MVGVQFKLNTSTDIGAEDTTSIYGVTWDSTAVADGEHTLTAIARDAAGNSTTSSTITITVDNTAPVRTSGSPSTELAYGTTSTNITLTTDESATCKYSTTADNAYGSMTAFTTTAGTSHASSITGLTNGSSYTYYVKCQDTQGTTNATDYTITFSIASAGSGGSGGGGIGAGGFTTVIIQNPGTTVTVVPTPEAPTDSADEDGSEEISGIPTDNTSYTLNTIASFLPASSFTYLSEDPTILTRLQSLYGADVVTQETYKNQCETNVGKPYYRVCELGGIGTTFNHFKDSVVCE